MTKENNIEATYAVCDDRFSIEQIAESHLILELSPNFFRFAIKDVNQTYVWLEDFNLSLLEDHIAKILRILESNTLLSVRFWKQITLLVHSNKKSFFPAKLHEDQEEKAFSLLFENNLIPFSSRSDQGTFLMSGNDDTICFLLDFYGVENVQLKLADELVPAIDKSQDFALFHLSGLSLIYRTAHLNTYWFENCTRMLKFASQEKKSLKLVVCGEVTSYSREYRLLENTIENIELATLKKEIRLSQYFQDTPIHRYYLIFNA